MYQDIKFFYFILLNTPSVETFYKRVHQFLIKYVLLDPTLRFILRNDSVNLKKLLFLALFKVQFI
jgi:hypothetical protein